MKKKDFAQDPVLLVDLTTVIRGVASLASETGMDMITGFV
jgi:hypothetical protein